MQFVYFWKTNNNTGGGKMGGEEALIKLPTHLEELRPPRETVFGESILPGHCRSSLSSILLPVTEMHPGGLEHPTH